MKAYQVHSFAILLLFSFFCLSCGSQVNLSPLAPALSSIFIIDADSNQPISNASLVVGGSRQKLSTCGIYSNSSDCINTTSSTIWTSMDPSIVNVNGSGSIGPVSPGVTTIQAKVGLINNTITIIVTASPLASIQIQSENNNNNSLALNANRQYKAVGTYADGTTQTLTTFVNWNSSSTSTATITNSGIATGVAIGTTNLTASYNGVTSANSISLNVRTLYAYISESGRIDICTVSPTTGQFSACKAATSTLPGGAGPFESTMFGNYFYVADGGNNTVDVCTATFTGDLSGCTAAYPSGSLTSAAGIAVNSTGTMAYVAMNVPNKIFACSINSSNGTFSSCSDVTISVTAGSGSLTNPRALAITGNYLYITQEISSPQNITCTILANGNLSSCSSSVVFGAPNVHWARNISIYGDFAYIASPDSSNGATKGGSINLCTGASTGNLSCSVGYQTATGAVGGILWQPTGMSSGNGYAYTTNFYGNNITSCQINASTGALSGCGNLTLTGSVTSVSGPCGILIN